MQLLMPIMTDRLPTRQVAVNRGCIQDYCGCMPIDYPSSEAKPIDLVEAANGQANLPNDLGSL